MTCTQTFLLSVFYYVCNCRNYLQVIADRCKGVKSVGNWEENNDLEMDQSQKCKSPVLRIFIVENSYKNPNFTTKEFFKKLRQ